MPLHKKSANRSFAGADVAQEAHPVITGDHPACGGDHAPAVSHGAENAQDGQPVPERAALIRALARRDECLARKRNYTGHSTHVRRKLDAALRAAESDVAILRYALGTGSGGAGSRGAGSGGAGSGETPGEDSALPENCPAPEDSPH